MPTAYYIRNGLDWLSPVATILDPASTVAAPARFVFHGWLYPWLIACLSPSGTWPGIFVGKAAVACLSFGAILALASLTLRHWAGVAAMGVAGAGVIAYLDGRPETIATPLLLILAARTLAGRFHLGWDAILLGLLFVVQPTICAAAAIGYSLYRLVCAPTVATVGAVAAIGLTSAATALLLFATIYPYGLADWAQGIGQQARLLAERREWDSFFTYYLRNPRLPLLAVPVAGAVATLLLEAVRSRRGAAAAWAAAAVALFVTLLLVPALRVPATIYNVMPWTLVAAWHWLSAPARPGRAERSITVVSLTALVLGSGVGIARGVVHTTSSAIDGRGAIKPGQRVAGMMLKACAPLLVSPALVPLLGRSAALPNVRYEGRPYRQGSAQPAEAYLGAQVGTGVATPPPVPGMTLVASSYGPSIRLTGITVFRTPTGHNFAAYVRHASRCQRGYAASRR